jgi:hypothetical protein
METAPTPQVLRRQSGYLPIENYGLIGNMRTCALVGIDGSVDFMCWYVSYSSFLPWTSVLTNGSLQARLRFSKRLLQID